MRDLRLVLDLQATMRVTEIVQPHREPTHPAVIPRRFGKGQGLTHFALIAQATGPIMPLHHTRVNHFVAQQGQDMLQTGFAMDGSYFHPLDPAALVDFVSLAHRPSLAANGPRDAPPGLWCRGAVGGNAVQTPPTAPTHTRIRIRKDRWQMPGTQTTLGVVHQGLRLFLRPFADDKRDHQLAVRRDRRMVPHVPSLGALVQPDTASAFFHKAPLLIKLQGAWGHVAYPLVMEPLGMAARHPEESCDRVFGDVPKRAVARTPHPSPR